MAIDRPDWQAGIDIEAQTLATLNMDIIAQTIAALKVDIIAQTLAELKINIAGQDLAQVAVDIAAQSIGNLAIDLVAQTIANLDINVNAQNIGLMLQSAWAASIGTDKEFDSLNLNLPWLGSTTFTYTVPAGKTLYITGFNTQLSHTKPEESASPLYFISYLYNDTTGITHCRSGGIAAQELQFTKPIVIPENEDLVGVAYNQTASRADIAIHASGYEV